MVCKEEVLSWFKELESYSRIDVMYELLNMCLPFELRFLGTCVEEIGKHAYQELRGPTLNANDLEKLTKDGTLTNGLLEDSVRHRSLIYLSLLSSRNYSVANWLFKNLLRTEWIEDFAKGNVKDENLQSEFLLLFVMALHHPAFTFEQKLFFGKILTQLIDSRENKNRISPKPSVYGYPPGFGYPTIKPLSIPEIPTVPVKSSVTIPCIDETLHQQPPGLPHVPPPPEFIAWSRPGFPCGAPEVPPPFPPANASPLVSQSASPIHSRSSSPHRSIVALRTVPMPPPQPPPPIDVIPVAAQLPIEPLSTTTFPFVFPIENLKPPEEDLISIPEEKPLPEVPWMALSKDPKQPLNGFRYPCPASKPARPFLIDHQFQALSLDGDNSMQHSNSSSSSSPTPEEPLLAQCPVRMDKPRVNGIPSFVAPGGPNAGGLPLCDTTSPPPPPPNFNNCSVPYTSYPTTFTAIPTRSMFPYNQSYRPPFTAHYPTYQNDNSFPTYTLPPFMPFIYSSSQFQTRNPNCYNCGATGHNGQDCTGQNIEDITQKKTYTLEFMSSSLPDTDK